MENFFQEYLESHPQFGIQLGLCVVQLRYNEVPE